MQAVSECPDCVDTFELNLPEPGQYLLLRCAHWGDQRVILLRCEMNNHWHVEWLHGTEDRLIDSEADALAVFHEAEATLLHNEG